MSELKRLKTQLEQLEKTYKLGIISEDEYKRGKDNIEKKLRPMMQEQEKKEQSKKIIDEIITKEPEKETEKADKIQKEEKPAKEAVKSPKPAVKAEKPAKAEKPKKTAEKAHKKDVVPFFSRISTWIAIIVIIAIILIFALIRGPDTATTFQPKNLTGVNQSVEIVAFTSYSCRFCSDIYTTLGNIKYIYGDNVEIIIKYYPLDVEDDLRMDIAAECAAQQGRFQQYSEALFAARKPVSDERLASIAENLDLNMTEFSSCVNSSSVVNFVLTDFTDAIAANIEQIPVILIDNESVYGVKPLSVYEFIIDRKLGIS